MKRLIVLVIAFAVSMASFAFADQEDKSRQHLKVITGLSKALADKDFEAITVVAKGASKEEALIKAAMDICDRIDLQKLSPALCKCINSVKFVPQEECALLMKLSHIVSETKSDGEGVTLVLTLDRDQIKQLAYFKMWPLFPKQFISKTSS